MRLGKYSYEEYLEIAAALHGVAAPGLVLGGFMVEAARQRLPEGTLFDAVVETVKRLPEAGLTDMLYGAPARAPTRSAASERRWTTPLLVPRSIASISDGPPRAPRAPTRRCPGGRRGGGAPGPGRVA